MRKRYQDVINMLELIKVNSLDPQSDCEAVELIDDLIYDLKSYELAD